MRFYKKSQMEVLGLIFIVFLMAMGMFFMVTTSNKENKDLLSVNPQNVELAQNTIDAIKYIKLDCEPPKGKKIRMDDLVRDMVLEQKITCALDISNKLEYKNSTYLVNRTIYNILSSTLSTWQKPYYFTITKVSGGVSKIYLEISEGGCTPDKPGNEGSQPSPLKGGGGTVIMKLFLCNS